MNASDIVEDSNGEDEVSYAEYRLRTDLEDDGERLRRNLSRLYDVDINSHFDFPETFNVVPDVETASRIWCKAMDYKEVERRLFGNAANSGPEIIPVHILKCFADIVDFTEEKIKNLLGRIDDNNHHISVLSQNKDNGKVPHFLQLKSPKIRYLEEEEALNVESNFRNILEKTSRELLDSILGERIKFRNKLCVEAEKMVEELRLGAMQIWMDSQGNWNAGDHLYPVKGFFRRARGEASAVGAAEEPILSQIPLSTVVFRAAMQQCNSRVSTYRMAKNQELQEKSKARKTEQKLRHEALAKISAAPRHEAENSILQSVQDMVAPFSSRLDELEDRLPKTSGTTKATGKGEGAHVKPAKRLRDTSAEETAVQVKEQRLLDSIAEGLSNLVQQIQGNLSAPMTADAYGAGTKSAKKSHTMKANQNASEEQQETADSEKRKLSRMSRFNTAHAAPEVFQNSEKPRNADQGKRPGRGRGGKSWQFRGRTAMERGRK